MSKSPEPAPDLHKSRLKRLEIGLLLIAVLLGFAHAWANRHYLTNSDAMSYLDVAETYLRRDWPNAVNAYWNPLYSWLIALALLILRPSPYWKFAVVHLVNFAIYLFALGSFSLLIHELIRRRRDERAELLAAKVLNLPDWALLALGYALFTWSALFLITLRVESPDLLVAAFVYLGCWVVLRIRRRPGDWLQFALLGIVLGFGYLAKSVMVPLSLVFMVSAVFSTGSLRRGLPRIVLTVILFALIAGPYIFAISRAKGRLTFGDSGKLNYLWSINKVTAPHWQGEEPGRGTPKHPTRKIFSTPAVYEFGSPIAGTYPVWYDPTYWYEGSVSQFDFGEQLRVFLEALQAYYELFHGWGLQYGLLVGLASLYFLSRRGKQLLRDALGEWHLLVPALAGMGIYSWVNVQGRYVASFIVLLWLALFSVVRLPHFSNAHRYINSIAIVLVSCIVFTTLASSSREVFLTTRSLVLGEDPAAHEQWQIAEALREKGVGPSDRIAFIGDSFHAFWAHLLGLRIVAEIHEHDIARFWEADASRQQEVLNAIAGTGVRAVVAESPPRTADLTNWQKLRNTDHYVYLFR